MEECECLAIEPADADLEHGGSVVGHGNLGDFEAAHLAEHDTALDHDVEAGLFQQEHLFGGGRRWNEGRLEGCRLDRLDGRAVDPPDARRRGEPAGLTGERPEVTFGSDLDEQVEVGRLVADRPRQGRAESRSGRLARVDDGAAVDDNGRAGAPELDDGVTIDVDGQVGARERNDARRDERDAS